MLGTGGGGGERGGSGGGSGKGGGTGGGSSVTKKSPMTAGLIDNGANTSMPTVDRAADANLFDDPSSVALSSYLLRVSATGSKMPM